MFTCPIVDEYGSSENGILAFQCTKGNMHIMSDHVYLEFLDESNRQVKPGELGRIVVTDLDSYGMPLIRYEIGDMGRPSNEKCSCGINLPLMEIVEGRKEDFIRMKEGKFVHAAYLCYTLKDDAVHEFKMYQNDINTLQVQIVKSQSFNSNSEKMLDKKLRTALGKDMKITFVYLDRIPREASGKLRYFVSEINT
jgi:phenylacetate-CoA ligase